MNSISAPMQPVMVPTPPMTASGLGPVKVSYPGEDLKQPEYEPEFRECFSKSMLRLRLKEFWGGKVTQKYVETYLDFMHLSGMIDNLEFLEYKNALARGQL